MTVRELIALLSEHDLDKEVWDYTYSPVEGVRDLHWEDPNYPYKDEKDVVIIE